MRPTRFRAHESRRPSGPILLPERSIGSPFRIWHNPFVRLIPVDHSLVILLGIRFLAAENRLFAPGTEAILDYDQYGTFSNVGTPEYKYFIKDREGLAQAVGRKVYPNVEGLLNDPLFKKMQSEKKLQGNDWDYVNSDNSQANFYKWSSTHDQPAGVEGIFIPL